MIQGSLKGKAMKQEKCKKERRSRDLVYLVFRAKMKLSIHMEEIKQNKRMYRVTFIRNRSNKANTGELQDHFI